MRSHWIAIGLMLAGAAPAGAQIWDGGRSAIPDPPVFVQSSVRSEVNWLRRNIRKAERSGLITRQEAKALRRQAVAIRAAEERYRVNGLSDSERAELAARSNAVRSLVVGRTAP